MEPMRELKLDGHDFAGLSAQILRQGGSFQFRARGASMTPFIRDGDLLTIEPADAAGLEIGDVVLYRTRRDRTVAHRVVGRTIEGGTLVLETRGDARLTSDGPVPADDILGRAVRGQRGDRSFRLDRGPWRLAARLWITVHPLRCTAARLVRGTKESALRWLQVLQSLPSYRRLARRRAGARVHYRPARARDAEDLARLFGRQSLPGVPEPSGYLARRILLGELDGLALISTVGTKVAGCVAVRRFPDDEPLYPGWWLLGPVVRARYRRGGIGEELLRLALERIAAEGATWVYLLASEDDAATRALARKAGFLPASLPALQARLEKREHRHQHCHVSLSLALHARHGADEERIAGDPSAQG
jgi:predicted N-acetyltransferase YhbS